LTDSGESHPTLQTSLKAPTIPSTFPKFEQVSIIYPVAKTYGTYIQHSKESVQNYNPISKPTASASLSGTITILPNHQAAGLGGLSFFFLVVVVVVR
jgi:hypothetical protein